MTMLSGILELPPGAEGRIRQFSDGLVEGPDDPVVPAELAQQYPLRQGQMVVAEITDRKSRRR